MLAIVLAGAAVIREILIAVALSCYFILQGVLRIPIGGSIVLFLAGAALYLLFCATAIGNFLGTIVRSMPQLALLFLLAYLPLAMLSGTNTPLESMPPWLAKIVQISPTVHFVSFAQAVLYRGAGFDVVWRDFVLVALGAQCFSDWLCLVCAAWLPKRSRASTTANHMAQGPIAWSRHVVRRFATIRPPMERGRDAQVYSRASNRHRR